MRGESYQGTRTSAGNVDTNEKVTTKGRSRGDV